MIKLDWPLDWPQSDAEVCEWLDELVRQSPDKYVFEFKGDTYLYFAREEDAIAFKLKFGI